MRKLIGLLFLLTILASCNKKTTRINTDFLSIELDERGNIIGLLDISSNENFVPVGLNNPLLTVRIDTTDYNPTECIFEDGSLILYYDENTKAKIQVNQKSTHIAFELIEIDSDEKIDLVIWGPYPTIINKIIGETVGVVRGEDFALGIQALNPKTLGGYPWKKNDCMPQLDIFEGDDYSDLNEEGKRYVLYRVEAAKPEDFGSTLQAYCRNRNKDRIIENWQHPKYLSPAYDDGGVIGSKIALFGCPVEKTLEFIGEIEVTENLPHPIIDGEWGKRSPMANASYLIMNFGEEDIEKAVAYTKQAGLKYLYHSGPFKTWGHFQLNDQFPNGISGLKNCVDDAAKEGIHVGVHTLSNFITTNDPYVTPVPDERLAKVGYSKLTNSIDETQKEIEVESPEIFLQLKNNNLKTVVIDEELIRYGAVSDDKPWKLLDCQRGAFGTIAIHHSAEAKVGLLADHAYKVFLTDADLTKEVAVNLAELYNQTGLRQISFDGLEGNRSTGMGNYGEILMTTTWYNHLDENIKGHFICDASRTSHYFWHIFSRMNWGEPWYAGFRESQTEYRFKNQKYFERNLMPGMLGWFLMTNQTSPEDIEWMLAKAAGYNAGFGFVCNYEAFEENGFTNEILAMIKLWENARLKGVFDKVTMEQLRDVNKEFHLESVKKNELLLQEIQSYKIEHRKKERQPGEPLFSSLQFATPEDNQSIAFILTAVNGDAKNIRIEVDNYKEVIFPITLKEGESIKFLDENTTIIYNKNWQQIKVINLDSTPISPGEHTIAIDCEFIDGKEPVLKLEIRVPGEKVLIKS